MNEADVKQYISKIYNKKVGNPYHGPDGRFTSGPGTFLGNYVSKDSAGRTKSYLKGKSEGNRFRLPAEYEEALMTIKDGTWSLMESPRNYGIVGDIDTEKSVPGFLPVLKPQLSEASKLNNKVRNSLEKTSLLAERIMRNSYSDNHNQAQKKHDFEIKQMKKELEPLKKVNDEIRKTEKEGNVNSYDAVVSSLNTLKFINDNMSKTKEYNLTSYLERE